MYRIAKCLLRASVSGLMALLVLWFLSIKYIHSFTLERSRRSALSFCTHGRAPELDKNCSYRRKMATDENKVTVCALVTWPKLVRATRQTAPPTAGANLSNVGALQKYVSKTWSAPALDASQICSSVELMSQKHDTECQILTVLSYVKITTKMVTYLP